MNTIKIDINLSCKFSFLLLLLPSKFLILEFDYLFPPTRSKQHFINSLSYSANFCFYIPPPISSLISIKLIYILHFTFSSLSYLSLSWFQLQSQFSQLRGPNSKTSTWRLDSILKDISNAFLLFFLCFEDSVILLGYSFVFRNSFQMGYLYIWNIRFHSQNESNSFHCF